MYVVLVRSCSNLNSSPYPGDLRYFHSAMASAGIPYEIQGWDDPEVDWKCYSDIILTSQIDYDQNIDEFLTWISNIKTLLNKSPVKLWNPSEIIDWNYNKEYLLELQSKNIRIPTTLLVKEIGEGSLSDWLEGRLDMFGRDGKDVTVVVKSIISAGGTSVWRCNLIRNEEGSYMMKTSDVEKLGQQMSSSECKPGGVLIQEYLPAIVTEGEWSLMYFNRVFSNAVVKTPRAHEELQDICQEEEFRVQHSYGGRLQQVQLENVPDKVLQFAESVLAQISGHLLHARVDIVNSEDGEPCLMELEVLDPDLFQTESIHGERYLQAFLSFKKEYRHHVAC